MLYYTTFKVHDILSVKEYYNLLMKHNSKYLSISVNLTEFFLDHKSAHSSNFQLHKFMVSDYVFFKILILFFFIKIFFRNVLSAYHIVVETGGDDHV
jgi:hypothetical protein